MKWYDIVLLLVNIALAILSCVGAIKSNLYFRKSKQIAILAQMNQALNELGEMLNQLPSALVAATSNRNAKGFNPQNAVKDIGAKLSVHLNKIMEEIPASYSSELRALQKIGTFDLSQYINSLIDGTAIVEVDGGTTLDRTMFDFCQERLRDMQEFLKKKIEEDEEKLR